MKPTDGDDNSLKSYVKTPFGITIIVILVVIFLALIGGFFSKGSARNNFVSRNFDPNYYLKH
jgi:hypothetical protein